MFYYLQQGLLPGQINKPLAGNVVQIGPQGQIIQSSPQIPRHPGLPPQRPAVVNSFANQVRPGVPQVVIPPSAVPGQPQNLNATLQASQTLILQQQQQLAAVQQQQLAIQQQQQQQQQQLLKQQQAQPDFNRHNPHVVNDVKYNPRSNEVYILTWDAFKILQKGLL